MVRTNFRFEKIDLKIHPSSKCKMSRHAYVYRMRTTHCIVIFMSNSSHGADVKIYFPVMYRTP